MAIHAERHYMVQQIWARLSCDRTTLGLGYQVAMRRLDNLHPPREGPLRILKSEDMAVEI